MIRLGACDAHSTIEQSIQTKRFIRKYINIIRTFYEQSDAKNSFVTVLRSDYFTVMRNGGFIILLVLIYRKKPSFCV